MDLTDERYYFWCFYEERNPQWRLAYDGTKRQINKYAQQTKDITPFDIIRVSLGTVVLYEGPAKDYVKV
jgi:hypothetical protein